MTKHLFLSESLFINLKHKHIFIKSSSSLWKYVGLSTWKHSHLFPFALSSWKALTRVASRVVPLDGIKGKWCEDQFQNTLLTSRVSFTCVFWCQRGKKNGKLEFLILWIFFIGIHPCLVTALLGLPTKCSPSTLRSKWSNTWGTHFTGNKTANKDHTACIIFCAGKSIFGSQQLTMSSTVPV